LRELYAARNHAMPAGKAAASPFAGVGCAIGHFRSVPSDPSCQMHEMEGTPLTNRFDTCDCIEL